MHATCIRTQGTWVWYTDPKTKALIGGQIVEVLAAGKDYQIRTYDNNVRLHLRTLSCPPAVARLQLCNSAHWAVQADVRSV